MAEASGEKTPDSGKSGSADALNQEDLDALLSGAFGAPPSPPPPMDSALGHTSSMDDELGRGGDESVLLTEENVEDILSGLDVDAVLTPAEAQSTPARPPAPAPVSAAAEEVSDDLIAALLSAAEQPKPGAAVVTENLAAAATAPVAKTTAAPPVIKEAAPLAPKLVDATESTPAPETTQPEEPKPAERGKFVRAWLHHYGVRAMAASAAGLLGATATFALLYMNQERRPTFADLGVQQMIDLQEAYERAQKLGLEGRYAEVLSVIAEPLAAAPASPLRVDAAFLEMEARFHTLNAPLGSPRYTELHAAIDTLTQENPSHARVPEALYWKARLYQRQELPTAAYETLQFILEHHAGMNGVDGVLLETAELALEVTRPLDAASYLQQLLSQHPGSRHAGEAKLLLADTYRLAGMMDDARTLYARTADNDPDPQVRAEAILRLGRLAYDGGDFASAESLLKRYLAGTLDFEGNDAVYLQLARTQRAMGKLTEARDTLTDLINFFPSNETVSPVAYVELTEISDALGLREEAMKTAQLAAVKHPRNPAVLKNRGIMLGLTGKPIAAAESLLAAEDAGAFDPEMLLTAARHLHTAGMTDQALGVYRRLKQEYAGLPAAIEGGIDAARLQYDLGNVREAVEEIADLELATAATPQHLAVLLAQAKIYTDLGWTEALGETARKVAGIATGDEDLAQAALGLLAAGETSEARNLYTRIDPAQLREPTAYALQWKLGEQLLPQAPREAIELMERAWMAFPEQRAREDEKALLRAYLAANRPAAARRVVMELAAAAREKPIDSIHLLEAAMAWGDYLYGRGDYRTAAEAYAMAEDAAKAMNVAPSTPGLDPRWAQYQRANALLQLRDYQGGLRLLDEIANSGAPWAKEAAAKASHTRLEQRLTASRASAG